MSIATEQTVVKYLINPEVTKYDIPFKYWKTTDLLVQAIDENLDVITLINDVDYKISTNYVEDGTLTRISDWGSCTKLVISRNLPFTQETAYQNSRQINAKTIENDFDKTIAKVNQLRDTLTRALLVSIADDDSNFTIPLPDKRRDMLLGFDNTGSNLKMIPGADVEGLLEIIKQNKDLMISLKDETVELSKTIKDEYEEVIGDDVNTEYIITHNLNTMNVSVDIWSNIPPILSIADKEIAIIDSSSIKITFPNPISRDSIRVIVTTTTTTTVQGLNSYVHVAWSNSIDGVLGFSITESDRSYLGIYVNHIKTQSINPYDYEWVKIKGETGLTGPKGDDGESNIEVQIYSSNGNAFHTGTADTILSAYVFRGSENITDELNDSAFRWTRKSTAGTIADDIWNTSSKAIGIKYVILTPEDAIGRTVFSCEVDI